MKDSYILNYPVRIVFGCGEVSALPSNLPQHAKRLLLVTGKHAVTEGLQARLLDLLKDFKVFTVAGVSPEPPLEEVDKLIKTGREEKIDAVIAAGGGSVIDTAKAAACLIPKNGWTADYFHGKKEIDSKGLFFAALPTTSGTGAEITKNSVLTDPEKKIKKSIRHSTMVPDLAIVDPELTVSCPPGLTAASGLDAYTQALESYISKNSNPASRAFAAVAIEKIYHNLYNAFKTPENITARKEMAEGSMFTAMAFSQSGLGAVHGLAHPIGSLLHVPHGVACAILLVPVLKYNMPSCREEYACLARLCGGKQPEDLLEKTVCLCREMEIPESFKNYGLERKQHYSFIIENCRSNSMKSNPAHMTDNDVLKILEDVS